MIKLLLLATLYLSINCTGEAESEGHQYSLRDKLVFGGRRRVNNNFRQKLSRSRQYGEFQGGENIKSWNLVVVYVMILNL